MLYTLTESRWIGQKVAKFRSAQIQNYLSIGLYTRCHITLQYGNGILPSRPCWYQGAYNAELQHSQGPKMLARPKYCKPLITFLKTVQFVVVVLVVLLLLLLIIIVQLIRCLSYNGSAAPYKIMSNVNYTLRVQKASISEIAC